MALAIASIAFLASSYGPPSVEARFRGETSFTSTGEVRELDAKVTLNPVAVAAAESAGINVFPPVDLSTHDRAHPLLITAQQIGPDGPLPENLEASGLFDLSACEATPLQPCTIDLVVRLTWSGPVPATAAWELDAFVSFAFDNAEAISDGASVTVTATDADARLTAYVLAAAGVGLLAAIIVALSLARMSGAAGFRRLIRQRLLPLGLAGALAAVAALLFAGAGPIRALGYEQELAILLVAQAIGLVAAHLRRERHDGLLETLVIGSVTFATLPVLMLTIAALQAYRPLDAVAIVAVPTFLAVAGLLTRAPIVSPSTGEPLTMAQRVFVHVQVAFATLFPFVGVAQGALSWGWNAWFDELDASAAPLFVVTVLILVGVGRWLGGRSRMLSVVSFLVVLGSAGFFAVSMAMRLPHPWLPASEVIVGFAREPAGLGLITAVALGLVGILGRGLHPARRQEAS